MNAEFLSTAAALIGLELGQFLARSGEYSKWLRSEQHAAARGRERVGHLMTTGREPSAWRRREHGRGRAV